jgi:beta-galactosidase
MKQMPFCDNWTCKHLNADEPPIPVRIPDDAMLREPRTEKSMGGLNVGWFEGRDYSYKKTFSLTGEQLSGALLLEFEGVYRKAEVYVNGEKAAFRPYGYTNFYVDLKPYVHVGVNEIEVRAFNADQPNSRWYSGAGIYRPVRLWTAPEQHIEINSVKIRTLSLDPATVEVTVKTTGDGIVKVELLDGETAIASASGEERTFSLTVENVTPWSADTPKLYTCRVTYGADEAVESFGFRTLAWGKDGLLVNGKREILRGACVHHDNGLLGAKCEPDALERRIRILKENGYNALRSAHNPCSKTALEICDRLGMYVMDEYIDHWYIHKTMYDYVDYFFDWWQQDLKDMVDKDYNHPSVILYSTGNEVAETAQPKGIQLAKDMTAFLHGLDATRPVTCGVNIFFNFLNHIGFGQYSDEKAKKEAERAQKAKAEGKQAKESSTGSKFFNDLAGIMGAGFMKTGATLHMSDVTTREAFANMDIAGYNYGEKRYKKDLKNYPDRLILGSETFCFDAYKFWELAKDNPRLIGDFVWAGTDYLGEVMVGSWEYSDYAKNFNAGLGWISAGSGRIDLTGKPLGEALYTRVALDREKGPYLAVRPLCHEGKHSPSAWKMTNAMPSWSWRGFEGKPAIVEVYARAASVELRLNNRRVDKKAFDGRDCLFRFKVPYQNGILEAIAYNEKGDEIGRDTLKTAELRTILTAESESPTVRRGRPAFIRVRYADSYGTTKPAERGILKATVEGGTLEAFGSACPFYEQSYLDAESDTYYGEALLIVRAGSKDRITVSVTDGNLTAEATVPIEP